MAKTMEDRDGLVRGQKIGGPTKAVILGLAVLLGMFDHMLHGWGRTAVVAGISLVAPVIGYRKYWKLGRFWITAVLLLVVQFPLVMLVQRRVESVGVVGALVFAASRRTH